MQTKERRLSERLRLSREAGYQGVVRLDRRTKRLARRLSPGEIALIDHQDIDRLSAELLIEKGVGLVLNVSPSITGRYPNQGPAMLRAAGMELIDLPDDRLFELVREGDTLWVAGQRVYRGSDLVAEGIVVTTEIIAERLAAAHHGLGQEINRFAANTLEFIREEAGELLETPHCRTQFAGRHALVVVRGYDYKQDIRALRSYINEMRPVLVGVDGGADALLEVGLRPHLIIGDMDSVSDQALKCGAELVVHAYPDGRAPGRERLEEMGLEFITFPARATSEDIALLLAYEQGAELIVAVGTHATLVEFLDKGREGMASTFLTRLRVGSRLVDAKGVSKLYRGKVKAAYLSVLLLAGLATLVAVIVVSPSIRQLLGLVIINLRLALGI